MVTNIVRILTIPAESIIGQGSKGIIRGCLDCRGEITVDAPFEMDTLRAFRIMAAFDRLVQPDGLTIMGCYFIPPKKRNKLTNCYKLASDLDYQSQILRYPVKSCKPAPTN